MKVKMKQVIYICCGLVIVTMEMIITISASFGQLALGTYVQYQQHPEQINPAYVLSAEQGKLYTLGRRQWMDVEGGPRTVLAGGHVKMNSGRSAIGANMLYDRVGPQMYTDVNAFYGYSLKLTEHDYLSASAGVGMRWYNVRYALLEHSDQVLPEDINQNSASVNLAFMYYRPEQLYVGVTLPRFGNNNLQDIQAFSKNYSVLAAYLVPIDDGFHIKANSWLSWGGNEINFVGNFSTSIYFNRRIGLGVNYGTTNDLGAIASFAVTRQFKFAYGYQAGIAATSMSGLRNATHEISLSYNFGRDIRASIL